MYVHSVYIVFSMILKIRIIMLFYFPDFLIDNLFISNALNNKLIFFTDKNMEKSEH